MKDRVLLQRAWILAAMCGATTACGRIGYDEMKRSDSFDASADSRADAPVEGRDANDETTLIDAGSDQDIDTGSDHYVDARSDPYGDASSDRNVDAGSGQYIEAEDGILSPNGFVIAADPTASAGHFLLAPAGVQSETQPGNAQARYTFDVATAATFVIWGRIHGPDVSHDTLWIRVDAGTWYLWRLATGEVWYWDGIHDDFKYRVPLLFDLAPGTHELTIANAADQVGLDRLYFTSSGDVPPGNENVPCDPPNSILLMGTCHRSCGSQGGNTCGTTQCAGFPTFAAFDCAACCIR